MLGRIRQQLREGHREGEELKAWESSFTRLPEIAMAGASRGPDLGPGSGDA